MQCPNCNGDGVRLGTLGNLAHYSCRDCGAGFSREISDDDYVAVLRRGAAGCLPHYQVEVFDADHVVEELAYWLDTAEQDIRDIIAADPYSDLNRDGKMKLYLNREDIPEVWDQCLPGSDYVELAYVLAEDWETEPC